MERFCEDLRAERIAREVSLEEIARVTKVPERYLRALEEGRLAELPGGIFRKGMLRSYLQVIGVEAAPWMARFAVCLTAMDAATEAAEEMELVAASAERRRAAEALPASETGWSGVMVALMLLLAFGWCVWRFALHGRVVLSLTTPVSTRGAGGLGVDAGMIARPLRLSSAAGAARQR